MDSGVVCTLNLNERKDEQKNNQLLKSASKCHSLSKNNKNKESYKRQTLSDSDVTEVFKNAGFASRCLSVYQRRRWLMQ